MRLERRQLMEDSFQAFITYGSYIEIKSTTSIIHSIFIISENFSCASRFTTINDYCSIYVITILKRDDKKEQTITSDCLKVSSCRTPIQLYGAGIDFLMYTLVSVADIALRVLIATSKPRVEMISFESKEKKVMNSLKSTENEDSVARLVFDLRI